MWESKEDDSEKADSESEVLITKAEEWVQRQQCDLRRNNPKMENGTFCVHTQRGCHQPRVSLEPLKGGASQLRCVVSVEHTRSQTLSVEKENVR